MKRHLGLDAATELAVTATGDFEVELDAGWWIEGTAYGGYLAAALLRAAQSVDAATGQQARSIAIDFHSPTTPGAAEVGVRVLHAGRSSASVFTELRQGGTVRAAALTCLARTRSGPTLVAPTGHPPPGPQDCPPLTVRPEIRDRYRLADRFVRRRLPNDYGVGGWIRFTEQRAYDELSAVAFLDSWTAAAAAQVRVDRMLTLSYFVQFLNTPTETAGDSFLLAAFTCDSARDGYAEDAGELRDSSHKLVARSRQVVNIAG